MRTALQLIRLVGLTESLKCGCKHQTGNGVCQAIIHTFDQNRGTSTAEDADEYVCFCYDQASATDSSELDAVVEAARTHLAVTDGHHDGGAANPNGRNTNDEAAAEAKAAAKAKPIANAGNLQKPIGMDKRLAESIAKFRLKPKESAQPVESKKPEPQSNSAKPEPVPSLEPKVSEAVVSSRMQQRKISPAAHFSSNPMIITGPPKEGSNSFKVAKPYLETTHAKLGKTSLGKLRHPDSRPAEKKNQFLDTSLFRDSESGVKPAHGAARLCRVAK